MKRLSSLYRFTTNFRSNYGQAGQLNFKLNKSSYDVKLETTWEDHTDIIVDGQPEEWLYEEDEQLSNLDHLKSIQDSYNIKALIPEYYTLKGTVNGNVQQVYGNVDAKLMGDIDIQITNDKGKFVINKIKSQTANLMTLDGSISVGKYLEGQFCHIQTRSGSIDMRKLATSKFARIDTENGAINIGAFYALSDSRTRIINDLPKNLQELQKYIKSICYLQLDSQGSEKVLFKNFSGALIAKLNKVKQLSILQMADTVFTIEQNEGDFYLGVGNNCHGVVELKNGFMDIQLNDARETNIYDVKAGRFLIENEGKSTVYVSASRIEIHEKKFFQSAQRS